jgi:AraC-like DNA-binding protein
MGLNHFACIADLYTRLGTIVDRNIHFSILYLPDLHQQLPYQSLTYRTTYFSIVCVKEGNGFYTTDDHRFSFENYTIYFTNPGHLKSYEINHLKEAYIIAFTEEFLVEHVSTRVYDEFPFLLAETVPPLNLSPGSYDDFERLYQEVKQLYQGNSPYRLRLIGSYIHTFLIRLMEQRWQNYNPIAEGSRTSQLIKKFKQLLESHYASDTSSDPRLPTLQQLSEEMNLHPAYMSQLIRLKTDKTVTDWINGKILSEAKAHLRTGKLNNKEISHRLGYSEATHFGRFFKQQTKLSPGEFRRKIKRTL